jgi:hypothetical protein
MAKAQNKKARKRKEASYKHFKLSKKIKHSGKPLPGAISLLKKSLRLIADNRRLFVGLIITNSLLSLIFVAGLNSSFDFVQTKTELEELLGGSAQKATTTLALFGYLFSSAGTSAGEVAGTYQLFLTLITSLAAIWSIRQVMAGEKVFSKDAFYRGLYPLVPFLLVLFVIGIQLLPALIGTSIYSIVISNSLAINALENMVWLLLMILLCLLSLYLILSSVFALYIVTLPEMTPMQALRSARGLVLNRRLSIGVRVVAMPLILLIAGMILLAPIILFLPWLAMIVFLIYSSFCLVLAHSYMYILYRAML